MCAFIGDSQKTVVLYNESDRIIMPLLRFDILTGRSDSQVKATLDAAHRAVLSAFEVPERDRYQIVHEHDPSRIVVEDTGRGFDRTPNVVVVSATSRRRSEAARRRFYADLCRELKEHAGIEPTDVIINFTTNTDADWSFGAGRAQFLTGEL
jgi:hypothetical protein